MYGVVGECCGKHFKELKDFYFTQRPLNAATDTTKSNRRSKGGQRRRDVRPAATPAETDNLEGKKLFDLDSGKHPISLLQVIPTGNMT